MNIFVTHPDPMLSAMFLDDKRVIKMVLESAQLLSTAMIQLGGCGPYKPCYINHPCSIWTRDCRHNYNWLYFHFVYLCEQYTDRYGKIHKCEQYVNTFGEFTQHVPYKLMPKPFANCTPFKRTEVHLAYRLTLRRKWRRDVRTPTWYGLTLPL